MTDYIRISEKLEKIAGPFFLGMNSSNWLFLAGIAFLFGFAGLLFLENWRRKFVLFYISFLSAFVGIWLGTLEGDYSREKIWQVMKENKIDKINARKLVQNVKILSTKTKEEDICKANGNSECQIKKEEYINKTLDAFYNSENTDDIKFKELEK